LTDPEKEKTMGEQRDWGTLILVWLPVLAFLAPLVWRLLSQQLGGGEVQVAVAKAVPDGDEVEESAADDLKRIEGIGPKISGVLNAAGITTFAQLAESTVEELARIVEEGGVKIAFPETWPEQASLAAAGKWEEFEALQDSLKGGRQA
jgi:predicted flap endonuclease-1-like 5' DNA nuclease